MSTIISGLPPRVAIREEDYATGSYPMALRTGDDSRLGNKSFLAPETITPFNESFRPDQNRENPFFEIGSKESETSLGFSSRLSSKTQIKFSLNVDSLTTLNAQTASIVYYNKNTKTFDLAGGSEALTDPGSLSRNGNLGRDSKLFNAIGQPIISGTAGAINAPSPYHGNSIRGNLDKSLSYYQDGSVTSNNLFKASTSHVLPMSSLISAPFLLEKAVIEMNISSSNGWFDDFTLSQVTAAGSDLGGPAVTVHLMNQIADNKRELILSSTIIPTGDTGSFAFKGLNSLIMPSGFGSFATPGHIVEEMGIERVSLVAVPAISNGFISSARSVVSFEDSPIGEVSSFGRSLNPKEPSGRSFFGKEFSATKKTSNHIRYSIEEIDNTAEASRGVLYQYLKEQVSPYLLFPEDSIILGVSKHRPAIFNINDFSLGVTGSHEFGIAPGNIDITLYGSLIKEEKEYHDTLNQGLTSNVVHEIVGAEPVFDQFDVESKASFTGSYIAEFFTGSIFYPNVFKKRKVRSSLVGTSNTLIETIPAYSTNLDFKVSRPGFNKNVQFFSEDERYFDSLTPRLDQIAKIEEADIINDSLGNKRNIFLLGKNTSLNDFTWIRSWDFLFLFESKYATVDRAVLPFRDTLSTKNFSNNPLIIESSATDIIRPISIGNGISKSLSVGNWRLEGIVEGTSDSVKAPDKILSKNVYGIGNGQFGEPIFSPTLILSTLALAFDSEVRGFKYGLLNASEEVKKYYFRRDRFGHFRDMVEQSKDSKLFLKSDSSIYSSPIKVRFVGSDGKFTNGEETFSNNVSLEATSSLPYFDGLGRSRGDLPDINIVP